MEVLMSLLKTLENINSLSYKVNSLFLNISSLKFHSSKSNSLVKIKPLFLGIEDYVP